jgi:hypothetical protein
MNIVVCWKIVQFLRNKIAAINQSAAVVSSAADWLSLQRRSWFDRGRAKNSQIHALGARATLPALIVVIVYTIETVA